MFDDEQHALDMRMPEATERAEMTSQGARQTDLEGMSQMSFQTTSQFGAMRVEDDDASSKKGSQAASVYTKPFTMQSNKASDKSKMG